MREAEPTWITAAEAVEAIIPCVGGDRWAAQDELRLLAAAGAVRTGATSCRARTGGDTLGLGSDDVDGAKVELPQRFWTELVRGEGILSAHEDWVTGSFRAPDRDHALLEASGVCFSITDLRKWIAIPTAGQPSQTENTGRRLGRPPASWWPAVLEEAVVDIHENGWPEGEEAAGVEQVINRLLARLSKRGFEPSRSTLQGPLRNALIRSRR